MDYYNSGPFLAMPLWYFDFLIFTPARGSDAPVFIGRSSTAARSGKSRAPSQNGINSVLRKLRFAFRLMIPAHRGIGWNWQVKGVPSDPNAKLSKMMYVRAHLQHVIFTYLRSVAMLVIMGFCSAVQKEYRPGQDWVSSALDAMIGWSGAIWVWDRLNCFYSAAAALSVAIGVCERWEWPPLTGQIRDAWSVRQMWSDVYHQVLRRMLQQPAIRFIRLLRLRKGSLASRYSQLYVSFAISCLFHEFQIFNVTRKDSGELAFFMSQPLAITAEDLVQWAWKKWRGQSPHNGHVRLHKSIGYIWVFLWFSYCLPMYIKSLRDADIIRDVLLEAWPLEKGSSIGLTMATALKA
ncbi:hypothetical protein BU16DRAFT_544479 [Lophium mytilinum]|uniref:Wax synthase domain-containing protein n=1 Tax=Lophium mytilinum TaxID=390894 RepID=A0A6A6QAH3_9PEZI|nr:hypothetical protein BU16DRAFT_544479 [Lophium mytilinum]